MNHEGNPEESSKAGQLIKELASAVSTQAQVANRVWFGLMTASMAAFLSQVSNGGVKLPFWLPQVDADTFHVILFLILCVLTIAFSSAYAQQFRAQILAQQFVDDSIKAANSNSNAHPRDRFDMLRLPTFNRVAPLAQLFIGSSRFYATPGKAPRYKRVVGTLYYILLKITSLLVYFGLPGAALFHSFERLPNLSYLKETACGGAALLAGISLVHVCIADLWAAGSRVVPRLWSGEQFEVRPLKKP